MTSEIAAAPTRRGILIGGAALTLAGCAGGGIIGPPSPAPQIYVLHPEFSALADAPNVPWQLIVGIPNAPESLDTERVALERAPNAMDYFANAQWSDRLPLMMQTLLVEGFEKSGRIAAVGRESSGIRADYILETEIRDFEAYYAVIDTPPKARVRLVAKLLSLPGREMGGGTETMQEVPAAANDMTNITAAFRQATRAAVEDVVGWALRARR